MSATRLSSVEPRLFPYERWEAQLAELSETYRHNDPYPHIHLADLLDDDVVEGLLDEFPRSGDASWIQYKHYNENKLGLSKREQFPPLIGRVIDEFQSPEFVAWLSELTGIPGLMSDPHLEGGGMHQTERGGFLNIHADFTMHHHVPNWRRRVNLILYLNRRWDEAWGGAIELWDRQMRGCGARIVPLANHAVIFSTTEDSFHGYPEPIDCPEDVSRKSLALYYYTLEDGPRVRARSTNYRPRPGDGLRGVLIRLDAWMVDIYSRVKQRFGLSDDFASRMLGLLSRKKRGR